MQFICYPTCSTCQKARLWLQEKGLAFDERNIKLENPSYEELKRWHCQSGLALKKFFNTSGLAYKALGLKEKLATMSQEEQLRLLASDGMLVKRPLLISSEKVLVGFKADQWEALCE